jgi:hypothetical protein
MKTMRQRLAMVSLFPAVSLLIAACAADTADTADPGRARPAGDYGANAHLLPMPGRPARALPAAGNGNVHMTYRGGPVISSVEVHTVFWGSGVPNQSQLDAFYTAIADSSYIDGLSEYDTPTQNIAHGSFKGSFVDTKAPSGSSVSDDAIQQEIGQRIDDGSLPQPDANTLFMVHFPAGVTITMQGSTSCQQFCAYHSSFTHGSIDVYYGVIPDFTGACAGCGGESDELDSTTVVSSHEVAEGITDPDIGVANQTQNEQKLGWYDDTNDEIGDVCQGQSATVAGYRVTKLWSNRANACIVPGSAAGGGGGAGGGGSGAGGGGAGSSCSHPICSTGAPLSPSCGPCTNAICNDEPQCCATAWDASCVQMARTLCGKPCQ